jgi:xanthine dehydrogenase small subunit
MPSCRQQDASPEFRDAVAGRIVSMRDYLLVYVNGRRCLIRGESAFSSLAEFLRGDRQLTGTKVVCAEGDCGACTVLVGRLDGAGLRYETVDSCIQFLHQLDCKHVVTVEGLQRDADLHPAQQALVDHHGSQCGYCTPGFVMALAGTCEGNGPVDPQGLRLALTGNLCRCTGYVPILEAGGAAAAAGARRPLAESYPSQDMIEDLRQTAELPVLIKIPHPGAGNGSPRRTFFSPRLLDEAVAFKAGYPEAVIVSGATELGVLRNKKGFDPPTLLSLTHVPDLGDLTCFDHAVSIGANVTWTRVEAFAREALPEFHKIIVRFGSPQIRNVSTLVANVAHGSPIADALPFLYVMEAEVEVLGPAGSRRVRIDRFHKGYKVKDLAPEEIITRVVVPLPAPDELLKLYKVSRRNDLDIATFGAGIRIKKAGNVITRAFVAYSGVAPTVVRLPATEAFLQGKLLAEETFRAAGRVARTEIQPISDVRGSRDFRWLLAENILMKFYFDCH